MDDEDKERLWALGGFAGLLLVMIASALQLKIYPALTSLLGMGAVALPYVARRYLCMPLPWMMTALTAIVTILHALGILVGAYDLVWWWDLLTHFMATSVIAVAANLVITVRGRKAEPRALPMRYVPLVSLGMVIVLGMVWELAEFSADVFFGTLTQYSLDDTAVDLSVDILGGVLVAILIPPFLDQLEEDYGVCLISP